MSGSPQNVIHFVAIRHAERRKHDPTPDRRSKLTPYGQICSLLMAERLRPLGFFPDLRFVSSHKRAWYTDDLMFGPYEHGIQLTHLDDLHSNEDLKQLQEEVFRDVGSNPSAWQEREAMLMGKSRSDFLDWMNAGLYQIYRIVRGHSIFKGLQEICVSAVVHKWWLDFFEAICSCSTMENFCTSGEWPESFRERSHPPREPYRYSEAVTVDILFDDQWREPVGVANFKRHPLPNILVGSGSGLMRELITRWTDKAENLDPIDQPYVTYAGPPDRD